MKTFLLAIAAALLIAGQVITPAAAASSFTNAVYSSESCGATYTVQHEDTLGAIAGRCGTTVANIMAVNPQITNANLIITGQVLNIPGGAQNPGGYATYKVQYGDTLERIASIFGITVFAIRQVNPVLWYNSELYTGQVLNIPASSPTGSTGYGSIRLSTSSAGSGDSLTVYVSGFPANASIDYRLGENGKEYSVVYDGTVAADGTASQVVTIPWEADAGENWVVLVITTSQKNGVQATSRLISITD